VTAKIAFYSKVDMKFCWNDTVNAEELAASTLRGFSSVVEFAISGQVPCGGVKRDGQSKKSHRRGEAIITVVAIGLHLFDSVTHKCMARLLG